MKLSSEAIQTIVRPPSRVDAQRLHIVDRRAARASVGDLARPRSSRRRAARATSATDQPRRDAVEPGEAAVEDEQPAVGQQRGVGDPEARRPAGSAARRRGVPGSAGSPANRTTALNGVVIVPPFREDEEAAVGEPHHRLPARYCPASAASLPAAPPIPRASRRGGSARPRCGARRRSSAWPPATSIASVSRLDLARPAGPGQRLDPERRDAGCARDGEAEQGAGVAERDHLGRPRPASPKCRRSADPSLLSAQPRRKTSSPTRRRRRIAARRAATGDDDERRVGRARPAAAPAADG